MWTELGIRPGVTAIIGAGGKTSLMDCLWRSLPGRVVVCTSTHIYPVADLPCFERLSGELPEKLCLGTPAEHGKLTAPVEDLALLRELYDFVLVEADGAKHLPLKAHLDHEPVIPACADQTICVVGLTGLDRPIVEVAHRPDRFAELCGARVQDVATAERVAQVLNTEALADRYVLNQADNDYLRKQGEALGQLLHKPWTLTSFAQK